MNCKKTKPNIALVEMLKVNGKLPECVTDSLSVEEPLEIQLESTCDGGAVNQPVAVTMRTPGHDNELCLGFLFSEAVISSLADVAQVKTEGCNSIRIVLTPEVQVDSQSLDRQSFMNSACGVCGKKSISAVMERRKFHIQGSASVRREIICDLPAALSQRQPDFDTTGGIHASALFDLTGKLIDVREDVGRHNALDKLIGSQLLLDSLPLSSSILLLSGRASFELIQKAVGAGIPIVAAVGAPSSLAVELARDSGMTLLGFVRDGRFNIYTGEQRIIL